MIQFYIDNQYIAEIEPCGDSRDVEKYNKAQCKITKGYVNNFILGNIERPVKQKFSFIKDGEIEEYYGCFINEVRLSEVDPVISINTNYSPVDEFVFYFDYMFSKSNASIKVNYEI